MKPTTPDISIQHIFERHGLLYAVITLNGSKPFTCIYNRECSHGGVVCDKEMIQGFDRMQIDSQVLGAMSSRYDLNTLERV